MNEKIKELADQAGLKMCGCGCNMPTRQTVKFAELIIKECINIADKRGAYEVMDDIIDHFGVE